MRLYGPAILLFVCAVWLAIVGDGLAFGVIALAAVGASVVVQVREQRRINARRRRGR